MKNEESELQSKISGLLSKLPSGFSAEIIEDNNESEASAEPQSEPGLALPDEMLATLSQAAESVVKAIFGDAVESVSSTVISPVNGSTEAMDAMRSMLRGMGIQRPRCYHYILDSNGQPVHSEDDEEVRKFQRDKKDILAAQSFDCFGMTMIVTTRLVVHNPMTSNELPAPRWATELRRADTGECGYRKFAQSIDEAWSYHRAACEETQRVLAKESAESEASNE